MKREEKTPSVEAGLAGMAGYTIMVSVLIGGRRRILREGGVGELARAP